VFKVFSRKQLFGYGLVTMALTELVIVCFYDQSFFLACLSRFGVTLRKVLNATSKTSPLSLFTATLPAFISQVKKLMSLLLIGNASACVGGLVGCLL